MQGRQSDCEESSGWTFEDRVEKSECLPVFMLWVYGNSVVECRVLSRDVVEQAAR